MPPMMTVSELKRAPREQKIPFEAVLVIRKLAQKKARNDSTFLTVELGDKTGLFHMVVFENSASHASFSSLSEGVVVRVQGHTDTYDNRFAPKLTVVEPVPEEELAGLADSLVECAPEDLGALWTELQGHVDAIGHERLRETVRTALREMEELFKITPGAISMHHAYRGGLMEHTVHMARAGRALFPLYPEVHADLALAGIILHDIGKCIEYTGALAPRKSRAGILQGHVVLGYRQARRAAMQAKLEADLLERLEHVILSHQGEMEWGAAAMAATPEAVFVSMVDNLDAKMGMVQHHLRSTPESEEFSEYVAGLSAPLLVRKPNAGA